MKKVRACYTRTRQLNKMGHGRSDECLTNAGRAFLDEARAILKQTDDAVGKVRAIAGKAQTELHIGDWPLATGRIMPALLRAYQQAMPNVKVKIYESGI